MEVGVPLEMRRGAYSPQLEFLAFRIFRCPGLLTYFILSVTVPHSS
jgi:hypothetical protein